MIQNLKQIGQEHCASSEAAAAQASRTLWIWNCHGRSGIRCSGSLRRNGLPRYQQVAWQWAKLYGSMFNECTWSVWGGWLVQTPDWSFLFNTVGYWIWHVIYIYISLWTCFSSMLCEACSTDLPGHVRTAFEPETVVETWNIKWDGTSHFATIAWKLSSNMIRNLYVGHFPKFNSISPPKFNEPKGVHHPCSSPRTLKP